MAKEIDSGTAVAFIVRLIASIIADIIISPLFRFISIFIAILFLILKFRLQGKIIEVIKKGLNYSKSQTSVINKEKPPTEPPLPYTLLKFFVFFTVIICSTYIISILAKKPVFDVPEFIIIMIVWFVGILHYGITKLENEGKMGKGARELTPP